VRLNGSDMVVRRRVSSFIGLCPQEPLEYRVCSAAGLAILVSETSSGKIGARSKAMTSNSARRFPANPSDEEIREQYDAMRSALVGANISRGIFRSQSEKRGVVIAELQRELQELEADLGNEARAKARLHTMNSQLVEVIREMEATGDAIASAVEDSESQSGFWLLDTFKRLVTLATRWRAVKAKAAQIAMADMEANQLEPGE